MSVFIIIVLISFILLNWYVASRMYRWLSVASNGVPLSLFSVLYLLLAGLVLAPLMSDNRLICDVGSVFMGFFMYLFIFSVLADIVLLVLRLASVSIGNSGLVITGSAVLILSFAVCLFGFLHAENLKIASYRVDTNRSALSSPVKIVLISDIHLGAARSEARLKKTVDAINEQDADIVCIAGDIFNNDFSKVRNPDSVASVLRSIRSRYGTFACLGNHDSGSGIEDMLRLLKDSNIQLLSENYAVADGKCIICGRADSSPIGGAGTLKRKSSFSAPDNPEHVPVIVLDHNPSHISDYSGSADLILCGHTHRGQVFPGSLITHSMYEVDYGFFRKDSSSPYVIVTSGSGCWGPPIRTGSNCEIAVIELC